MVESFYFQKYCLIKWVDISKVISQIFCSKLFHIQFSYSVGQKIVTSVTNAEVNILFFDN